jgi:excisionase family DNA binding protein
MATSMQHTLGSAARVAGLSKSTLSRAIKDGKLSAIRCDDTGSYKIEQSELERYAAAVNVVRATAENRAALPERTHQERQAAAVLEAENAGLKQLADLLRSQLRDTQQQRDAWRQEAERLALPPLVPPSGSCDSALREGTKVV